MNIFFCLFFYSEAFLWSAATSTDYYVRPFLCPMTVRYLSAYCSSEPLFLCSCIFFSSHLGLLLLAFPLYSLDRPYTSQGSRFHFKSVTLSVIALAAVSTSSVNFFNLLFLDLDPVCAIRPVAQPLHLPAWPQATRHACARPLLCRTGRITPGSRIKYFVILKGYRWQIWIFLLHVACNKHMSLIQGTVYQNDDQSL